MKRAILLLGITLILATRTAADSTTTAPTTGPTLKEFVSREHRLRLKYPADWIISKHPAPSEIFSIHTPSDEFVALNLRIDKGPQTSSDTAILMDLADTLASFVFKNGGQHVKIKPDKLGILPARRISFTNQEKTDPIQALYIVAVKDRVEYVFNFAAPARLFDSLLPAVNEMLKSFELLD